MAPELAAQSRDMSCQGLELELPTTKKVIAAVLESGKDCRPDPKKAAVQAEGSEPTLWPKTGRTIAARPRWTGLTAGLEGEAPRGGDPHGSIE